MMLQSVMALVDGRYDDRNHLSLGARQLRWAAHQRRVELEVLFHARGVVAVDAKDVVDPAIGFTKPVIQSPQGFGRLRFLDVVDEGHVPIVIRWVADSSPPSPRIDLSGPATSQRFTSVGV